MASYPPPYPPPSGAPFRFDSKQQARFAREQMKAQRQAQRAAFKAQAYAFRQQSRAMRRSSVLGPLLVLTIGIVALLIRTGKLSYQRFAAVYLHWWPILLVAAGVVLALEWAFDQMPRDIGIPYVRRGIGGAAVLLVLTLVLTGAWAAHPDGQYLIEHGLSINPDNIDQLFGEKHQIMQQVDEDFAPGGTLVIDNPHGDVTIVGGSSDGKLHMTVNKEVWTRSDDAAGARADEVSPHVSLAGSTLNVIMPSVGSATTDLNITVPEWAAITVNANHGGVNVSGMKGTVQVTANHGDVELNAIQGEVTTHMNQRGSSFTARDIAGDVTVRGHAQDVNLAEVSGRVSLEGEFFGETHLQHLEGPVNFHTSRTQFSMAKLAGEVDISPNSELTGDQMVGPTLLRTSSRNISLERVAGDIEVNNSKGSVTITRSGTQGNISVENRDGAVDVTLPDRAGVTVDAETRGGEIQNDLSLAATTQNERTSLHGTVGDGSVRVVIRTSHFDIGVHKGDVQPPSILTPAVPVPPAAPKTKPPGHKAVRNTTT